MTDFKTVIEEYRRMCASTTCDNCVFGKLDNQCDDIFDEMEPESIELAVMAWSKNHPKKVYPTWIEWLEEVGVMEKVDADYIKLNKCITEAFTCAAFGTEYTRTGTYVVLDKMNQKMFEPIPDDIAEKLGIKPKNEGK